MGTPHPPLLVTHLRVLFALVMREMSTRFGRSVFGYVWALAEPAGFIALLAIAFSQISHDPPYGRSFALFYATGYLAYALYNDIAQITSRSVLVNRPLLHFPAVNAFDTVLARFLLQLLTSAVASALILTAILWTFAEPVHLRLLPLMQLVALGGLLGLGAGLCNAVLFCLSKSWELVWGLVSRPLFLVSAVFFSFESLPAFVREALWWNPVVHLVGLARRAVYPVYDGAHVAPGYVLAVGLGLLLAGLLLVTRLSGRMAAT